MAYSNYYKVRKVSRLGQWLNTYFADFVAKEALRYTKDNDAVVEIGPGEGRVADMLKTVRSYIAYEASPSLASELRKKNIIVRESYVPPLLESDNSQMAVVATHVLEHMPDHVRACGFFSEVQRVLIPGGIFLVIAPDFNDMKQLFFDADYSHGYPITANRLSQLAKDSGLRIIRKQFIYGSLPVFPGLFFNLLMKGLFFFLRFYKENFVFEYKGVFKLEYLFSRAVYMIFQKPENNV